MKKTEATGRYRKVGLAVAVVVALGLPASASSSGSATIIHSDASGSCQATGWHTHDVSLARFSFGTYEKDPTDCVQVKVQGRYWTDAPPYGWVMTSVYSHSSAKTVTRYDAPVHDYSNHWACMTTCSSATIY